MINTQSHTILSRDTPVEYNDEQHRYYINQDGKFIDYISATTIVGNFYEKFNTLQRAQGMVAKYGQSIEYWVDKWRGENTKSLDRGHDLHNIEEQFLYNRGFTSVLGSRRTLHVVHRPKKGNRNWIISNLADGCYPELKLWRHDWCIAGRADKPTIETINGVRFAHIEDYKTNKVIHQRGYQHDKTLEIDHMLAPLQHLEDCEIVHYTLQLSIYQFMLEYFGYKPGIRRIIHFPHEIEGLGTPPPKPYELPYLRNEVLLMLNHLKTNHHYAKR